MNQIQSPSEPALASALPATQPRRGLELREYLLASAMAVTVLLGSSQIAEATTIQFNPAATNNGLLQLYSSQGAFPVTGGTGALYEDFALNSAKTGFNGAMVVNLTGFTGLSGTGINLAPGWQLFAAISLAGTANVSGTSFTATSDTFGIQLYGVNPNLTYTSKGGTTHSGFNSQGTVDFAIPGDSARGTTVPNSDTSLTVTNLVNNGSNAGYNVGNRANTEYSGNLVEPDGVVGNASGNPACIDSSTKTSGGSGVGYLNSTPSFTGSQANCILLAYGADTSSTAGNLSVADNSGVYTTQFTLDAVLTAASYATGANGFFGIGNNPFDLTIVSGSGGSEGPDGVSYDHGSSGQPNYYATNGDPVSFSVPAVPEPQSLPLFATALLALAVVRRRQASPSLIGGS